MFDWLLIDITNNPVADGSATNGVDVLTLTTPVSSSLIVNVPDNVVFCAFPEVTVPFKTIVFVPSIVLSSIRNTVIVREVSPAGITTVVGCMPV